VKIAEKVECHSFLFGGILSTIPLLHVLSNAFENYT